MGKMSIMLFFGAIFAIFFACTAHAGDIMFGYSPEKSLYVLDNGSHSPYEFRPLINDICIDHPQYSKGEVAYLVVSAYKAVQESKPDISMYEVVEDLRRYTEDDLGIDLATLAAAYARSQVE